MNGMSEQKITRVILIILTAQTELENAEDWETEHVKAKAYDKIRDLLITIA